MQTPIQQLIEEIRIDVNKCNVVMKRTNLTEHQKDVYNKEKETLCYLLLNLETNYLKLESNYINKLKS